MGKGERAQDQHNRIPREALERGGMTRAIQTQEWVQDKIAEGDIEGGMAAGQSGTSIFDPVLCELAYRWFCPPGGTVLDPFAGGSVRGVVASVLGRSYVGIDLSARQIAANEVQAARICGEPAPRWIVGDSRNVDQLAAGLAVDFVFSCPPYADLEIYSDDPADLSTLAYDEFRTAYSEIIAKSAALLKPDRFACFVVGEVRGKDGGYYGLIPDTIAAFRAAGLKFYNEGILVTAAGSLPIRAAKQFEASRKLGKTHQNVLVFCKGDPRKATAAIGRVEFEDFAGQADPDEAEEPETEPPELTPIEAAGDLFLKRDDHFSRAGMRGGKVRTCWRLAQGAQGLVTAGSRSSPQINIVAHVARALGIPCRAHAPSGALSPELLDAQAAGAEIIQHSPGYNSVLIARARADANERGWREIPFGMECREAVRQTASQIADIPEGARRIVVPVGSGMSLAGILTGMRRAGLSIPVLGVVVGADPVKRLDRYAPEGWRGMAELVPAGAAYDDAVQAAIGGVELDPHYEAKCARFLEPGDLLWIVGVRATAHKKSPALGRALS
jgi:hypothetical protein